MIGKRMVAGAACAGVLVVVAGCSSDAEGGNEAVDAGPAQTGPDQEEPPNEATDGRWDACEAAEGSLTWYSAIGDNVNVPFAASFEEAYPDITVDFLRLTTGQAQARYASEREANAPTADVVTLSGSADWFADVTANGWFETELDLPALEEWPEEYYSDGLALASIVPYGIAYNTNLVSTPPESYEDLLSDEFANGAIVLPDPSQSLTQIALSTVWLKEYGEEYLRDFIGQQPQIVDSITSGIQLVSSGSAKVSVGTPHATAAQQKADGAPVEWVSISPTTGAEFLNGVSTETANPNAARCFSNYMLTEAGQTVLNGQNSVSPLGDHLPGVSSMPEAFLPVTSDEADEARPTIFEIYGLSE